MVAGADILCRRLGTVAVRLEPLVEAADDIVIELVPGCHGLRLRLRQFHQLGIDAYRGEPVVRAVTGNHGGGSRGVELRAFLRHVAIKAGLPDRGVTVAGAGAEERKRREGDETHARAREWAASRHFADVSTSPIPTRPAWPNVGHAIASS